MHTPYESGIIKGQTKYLKVPSAACHCRREAFENRRGNRRKPKKTVCLYPRFFVLHCFFYAPFPLGGGVKPPTLKPSGRKTEKGNDMEYNTNEGTQADNMGTDTNAQGNGKDKLFTQEEVNSFIQSRMSRMKAQASKEAEAEYNKRLAVLEARERKLLVKEQLSARGMSADLAEVITCTDENDLKAKLDKLQAIYGSGKQEEKQPTGFIQVGVANAPGQTGSDPVRAAMGLDY